MGQENGRNFESAPEPEKKLTNYSGKKWVKNWGEKGKITRPKKWDNRRKKGRGKANTAGTVFPEPGHKHNFSENTTLHKLLCKNLPFVILLYKNKNRKTQQKKIEV